MSRRERRHRQEHMELDDEEDVREADSLRVRYAERAKKRDIGLALRATCQIFVKASNAAMKDIGTEGEEQFCLFASSFIGRIWMDSVRSIIDAEYSESGSGRMSLDKLRLFKLRVCNYLRKLFPGAANQRIPAPLLAFSEFLKDDSGDSFPGPAGRFLVLKLIPHLNRRHERRMPSKADREKLFQRHMQQLREIGDPVLFSQGVPEFLAFESKSADPSSSDDDGVAPSEGASASRSIRVVHRSEYTATFLQLMLFT